MKRRDRAFTLFEVLIAMGIFGMVVIGMMMALDSTLAMAKEIRLSEAVRSQLENRLALLEGGELKVIERKTQTTSPDVEFVETVRKEQVYGKNRVVLDGFWRVSILAKWKEGGEELEEEASILRYGP